MEGQKRKYPPWVRQSDRMRREREARGLFDPPLPGRLLAGCCIAWIPESDIKYKSFLDWWFAVGRKAPALTAKEWGTISGRGTAWGESAIPEGDWKALPETEQEAIREWAESIRNMAMFD